MDHDLYFKTLFDFVAAFMEMTEHDQSLCKQYFEPISFPKNTILEDVGRIPRHQYFIVSGIVRNYHYDTFGSQVTIDMNFSSRFFTSYNHFVNRTISNEIIECVTECKLLRITRDEVDILYAKSDILKDFTIKYLEKVFEDERTRIMELATLAAEERYRKIISKAPHMILEVPLQYLASYLGVKPETLSRIRRRIVS